MLHPARFGHRYSNVNCGRHSDDVRCSPNAIGIIDAVLQANHDRARLKKPSHLFRHRRSVVCFHAKKNYRTIPNRAHLDCRRHRDSLLALQFIENKAFGINCVSEMFSTDENSRRARTGKHATKITTHSARAYDCNSWPFFNFAHWLSLGSTTWFKS